MALLNDSDSSSKNIERLPGSGGLYILKQSHLLFDIVSSEQMHSEKLCSKSLILLQIIFILTNTKNVHFNQKYSGKTTSSQIFKVTFYVVKSVTFYVVKNVFTFDMPFFEFLHI